MWTETLYRRGQNALILICLAALILAPRPIAGWLDLESARRFQAAGDPAAAAARYASAAARLPGRADLWQEAGLAALEAGQPDAAIAYLEEAGQRGALTPDGWLALGDTYERMGWLGHAIRAWSKAGKIAPVYERFARVDRARGEFRAAISDWRALLEIEPENSAAHYQFALLLAATDPQAALPELTLAARDPALEPRARALQTAINTAFLSDDKYYQFFVIGRALAAQGEWDLAAEAFRRSAEARPYFAEPWAWLGEAKQQLDLDGSAELEIALGLDPQSAVVRVFYGMYWQRHGQPQKMLEAYQMAVKLEPENSAWHVMLGSAYEQDGDLVPALNEYLRAVELDPGEPSGWRALALYSAANGYDLAGTGMPAAQRLLVLAPEDWAARDAAGQVTFALGNLFDAERQFTKAVELAPAQPAPHLHLALVYLQKGDRTAARAELETALALDPDGRVGWQAGRLLEQYFP
jgi:tetratricopeptide (TPR) repeat protein